MDYRLANAIIAVVLISQAVAIMSLMLTVDKGKGWGSLRDTRYGITEHDIDFRVTWLVVFSLLWSGICHAGMMCFSDPFLVNGKSNNLRWMDYRFSAGAMLVAVYMLVGVQDMMALLFVFLSNWMLQLLGQMIERFHRNGSVLPSSSMDYDGVEDDDEAKDREKERRQIITRYEIEAWFIFLFQWIFMGYNFGFAIHESRENVPDTVIAIPPVLFFFFSSFGIIQFLETRNYITVRSSEISYFTLGIASKTFLAWMISQGSLRE